MPRTKTEAPKRRGRPPKKRRGRPPLKAKKRGRPPLPKKRGRPALPASIRARNTAIKSLMERTKLDEKCKTAAKAAMPMTAAFMPKDRELHNIILKELDLQLASTDIALIQQMARFFETTAGKEWMKAQCKLEENVSRKCMRRIGNHIGITEELGRKQQVQAN